MNAPALIAAQRTVYTAPGSMAAQIALGHAYDDWAEAYADAQRTGRLVYEIAADSLYLVMVDAALNVGMPGMEPDVLAWVRKRLGAWRASVGVSPSLVVGG